MIREYLIYRMRRKLARKKAEHGEMSRILERLKNGDAGIIYKCAGLAGDVASIELAIRTMEGK